nr:immunoglobulin light chain junction region [Macaca mulatta]MOW54962.1 immunoglobulin light chain junction region [Macaca mulatta]MOW55444.1 immunoglobulin light chain junction region [Macaca mulatta]MOY03387.1 immunoglobulin light chain junction region [Macaca mulatta]MOY03630.1 immunoglobulin light chain junction region [Macaca mulatta]
CMQPLQFPWTF